jgi:hypothetical protein
VPNSKDIIGLLVVGNDQALIADGRMLPSTRRYTRDTLARYGITLGHPPDDAVRHPLVPPRTLDPAAAPPLRSPGL